MQAAVQRVIAICCHESWNEIDAMDASVAIPFLFWSYQRDNFLGLFDDSNVLMERLRCCDVCRISWIENILHERGSRLSCTRSQE